MKSNHTQKSYIIANEAPQATVFLMSANTSGIPSVDLLESYEGAELLWILHSRFDGRALTALNQFLQYSQTLKLISKRNQKDWEFIDDGLENDSIPIVLLKKLFDKLEYGIVTCFKQRLCDREENKLKGMLLVPEEDDKVLLSQLATRFTMLVQNPPKYISIESGVYNTEVLKSLHSTKIRWLRRDLTEAKYLANLEKGTFTRDNLGFPSMEKIALKYGIKKSLISTCTPFTGTKNTKNKFDTENYPLYAGNVASLIHFYSSVIVQLFERLSTFCQCMPESTTITSAARNSPEYIALFSRNLDSVVDPFKGGIPTVLKRMLGLQEKIASSADLFFLYHKYIPIEFPKYIPGFWKNKLDILTIFVDYGDVFVKFFQEVSKLKVNPLENFLSANDVVVARIITRLLSALKEFLDDLSNEKLQAYRVFFLCPEAFRSQRRYPRMY